jgi:hypothetical protein
MELFVNEVGKITPMGVSPSTCRAFRWVETARFGTNP